MTRQGWILGALVLTIFLVQVCLLILHGHFQIFLLIPLIWVVALSRKRAGRAPKEVWEMIDLPFNFEQFPVRVGFHTNGRKKGEDEGVITFTNDLMHFEGRRVSFDLPSSAITHVRNTAVAKVDRREMPGNQTVLGWSAMGAIGVLTITPYQLVEGESDMVFAFRYALAPWFESDPVSHRHLIFPPIESQGS
jgi:hypothetical protein